MLAMTSAPASAATATIEEVRAFFPAGGAACFVATFDAAHLASHPSQAMVAMQVFQSRPSARGTGVSDVKLEFETAVRFRTTGARWLRQTMVCSADAPGGPATCASRCGASPAGEAVSLARVGDGDLLIRGYRRIGDTACGDDAALNGRRLTGVTDDIVLLKRAPAALCTATRSP